MKHQPIVSFQYFYHLGFSFFFFLLLNVLPQLVKMVHPQCTPEKLNMPNIPTKKERKKERKEREPWEQDRGGSSRRRIIKKIRCKTSMWRIRWREKVSGRQKCRRSKKKEGVVERKQERKVKEKTFCLFVSISVFRFFFFWLAMFFSFPSFRTFSCFPSSPNKPEEKKERKSEDSQKNYGVFLSSLLTSLFSFPLFCFYFGV